MLTAPGWMIQGHATYEGDDVYELTIQDSPLQIAVGSLLWVENLKDDRTEALGRTDGFATNRENLVGQES
jgi:gentisate 1,2-dioxygenase